MTDAELLLQVQRGDMAAWESLYARLFPSVWRYANGMVSDVSMAEEIVSETLLALVRHLHTLDPEVVRLYGWLRGVVQHKAADQLRQTAKRRRLWSAARERSDNGQSSPEVTAPLETEETRQDVLAILDRLPDLQRLVLEWKHADDQSVREISDRLGQTEKSVESLLYRARKEFRRLYEIHVADELQKSVRRDARETTLEKSS